MDAPTRAMWYALRHPGPGLKPAKLSDIQKLVAKKDGRSKPSLAAISKAAAFYKDSKAKRGRKLGQRATSKAEDKKIMQAFKKLRPPGHGVDSNVVQKALPKKLKLKVSRRTVRRRLAEKGFVPQKKRSKSDLGPARMKKRLKFCRKHAGKSVA